MKTANKILKLFLVSMVLIACNAEDPAELDASLHVPNVVTPAESAGTFTALVDGQDFTIDIATAIIENNVITISGKKGNEVVTLRMPANITTNNVTTPYVLGGASDVYSAFYNTDITNSNPDDITTSHATTKSDLYMTIDGDENYWIADDAPTVSIVGGVTTITGGRLTNVDTGVLLNGAPVFELVNQSVNMVVQENQTGSYTFGATNLANYSAGGTGGDVFEADTAANNGTITLEVDDVNKLVSGTFIFDGTETYTQTGTAITGTDTDGDGMLDGAGSVNGTELNLGYDPNDPCSPIMPEGYTGYDQTNAIWLAADCDGDLISNEDELLAGTDPYEGNTDTDGDGVSDAQEVIDGTDENDPCDPTQDQFYTNYSSTNATWMAADCDGDTINNGDELEGPDGNLATTADNTNPYFKDFLTKNITGGVFSKIPYAEPAIKRGLNITAHDVAGKRIVGSFSFVSASIGEDPRKWYVITGGTFNVKYSVPE